MEAALCERIVDCIDKMQSNVIEVKSILSYTESNDDIMKNHLLNKDLAMCILSELVYYYKDIDIINNNIKNWGIDYKLFTLDTLVYVIFYSKTNVFIVFKGTTKFKEVISEIDFIQIDDSYNIPGKMHRGFHNLILKNKVAESIKKELENITSDSSIPIIITGHSLGAALATIFHVYLKTVYTDRNLELITFGSPRVGDYTFSNSFISTRFVHGNDIITKIPYFKYNHPENLIRLGNSYSCRVFTDHLLDNYYSSLIKEKNE